MGLQLKYAAKKLEKQLEATCKDEAAAATSTAPSLSLPLRAAGGTIVESEGGAHVIVMLPSPVAKQAARPRLESFLIASRTRFLAPGEK